MSTAGREPAARFGDRVADYAAHRPDYPPALFDRIEASLGLPPRAAVAELGAGTGIFTRHLLDRGWMVHALEPNPAMRAELARSLGAHPRIAIGAGPAERTGLADAGIDLVTAAQAFHWFEPQATSREVRRIARPGAWFLFVWNTRRDSGSPFLEAYEEFLREWSVDYEPVRRSYEDEAAMAALAEDGIVSVERFPNPLDLDRERLVGYARSASYLPGPRHPRRRAMLEALERLFDRHATAGRVRMEFETRAYRGRVAGAAPGSPRGAEPGRGSD